MLSDKKTKKLIEKLKTVANKKYSEICVEYEEKRNKLSFFARLKAPSVDTMIKNYSYYELGFMLGYAHAHEEARKKKK